MLSPILTPQLIAKLEKDFLLDWKGTHGIHHWTQVRQNALDLCKSVDADPIVAELFAFLHDSQRLTDDYDPHHGRRAADYIDSLLGHHIFLNDNQVKQLKFACAFHTLCEQTDDCTVMVCWDADRLDLVRVGITPDPSKLHTDAAKHIAETLR